MDHAAICNCMFKDTCETYADELIRKAMKRGKGLGCEGQSDFHRTLHCKSFRCKRLSLAFSDMLAPEPSSAAVNG